MIIGKNQGLLINTSTLVISDATLGSVESIEKLSFPLDPSTLEIVINHFTLQSLFYHYLIIKRVGIKIKFRGLIYINKR